MHDALVLGLGGMGSAAAWHLARRGARVLGLEQQAIAHDRGSSHGETRIVRKAYFEHAAYVPLLERAYALWDELERDAGHELRRRTGVVVAGAPGSSAVLGIERASALHGIPVERVDGAAAAERWPAFRPHPELAYLFEPDAGALRVEACVRAQAAAAARHGAELRTGERALAITSDADGVTVETDRASHRARELVVCAGAWTGRLLRELRLPLEVRRTTSVWFEAPHPALHADSGAPIFGFALPEGFLYGFPAFDRLGVKLASHRGSGTVSDPDRLDRELHDADVALLRHFAERYLAPPLGEVRHHAACMYTMTPDEHFVIDRHRTRPHVTLAAGFSGHGFKFAPVVGEVLADLALEGSTDAPIEFLRLARPALAPRAT